MNVNMQAAAVNAMNSAFNFNVEGMTLVGFELPGTRAKNGVRTKGIAQRRSRRRTHWVPVWAAAANQ